jgi:hypothetical protein
MAQLLLGERSLLHFLPQPEVGGLEFMGAGGDEPVESFQMDLEPVVKRPLARERVRELEHLDVVERLFQNHEIVGLADLADHFLPRVVGVGGADDDLQLGIHFPDPADRLDAVPARGHAHIHECHRIRPAFVERVLHLGESLLALEGRVDLEFDIGQ